MTPRSFSTGWFLFDTHLSPLSKGGYMVQATVSKPVSLSMSINLAALTGSETPWKGRVRGALALLYHCRYDFGK